MLGLPVWYLPNLQLSTDVQPFRISANIGTRANLGVFTQVEVLFPLNDRWYAGGNIDIYTDRGLLIGPSLRYIEETETSYTDWFVSSGWIHDSGDRGVDIFGVPVPKDRYFLDGFIRKQWNEKHQIQGVYSLATDPELIRDLHYDEFYDNQQPDNFLEYLYQEQDWAVSAFVRGDPNHFYSSDSLPFVNTTSDRAFVFEEKLPEVRFDLHPVHIGGGFYNELSLSAAQMGHTFYLTEDRKRENYSRFDGFYRVQKTIPIGEGGILNLFGGYRAIELKDVPTAVARTLSGDEFEIAYPAFNPGMFASEPMELIDVSETDFS